MKRPAAQALADLSRTSLPTAMRWLERAGFAYHHTTRGGYREFRHLDGSTIWIRPAGEVVRLGPRKPGTRQRQRYDASGKPTDLHVTGEQIRLP